MLGFTFWDGMYVFSVLLFTHLGFPCDLNTAEHVHAELAHLSGETRLWTALIILPLYK